MLIAFEELLRNTSAELEFDVNINTDVSYDMLTRAQEEYITQNFLLGDSIQENINAVRKRSDVLAKIIKRSTTGEVVVAATATSKQIDGGYLATIETGDDSDGADYWMLLSGVFTHSSLATNSKGAPIKAIDLELINHYDLQKKVRTLDNEPILKNVPIVLEGDKQFVFYLDEAYITLLDATINSSAIGIIYLARPSEITRDTTKESQSLAESTHNDIVKLAVEIFLREYKYKLGANPKS